MPPTKSIRRIEGQSPNGLRETVKLSQRIGKRDGVRGALGVEKMIVLPVLDVWYWKPVKAKPIAEV